MPVPADAMAVRTCPEVGAQPAILLIDDEPHILRFISCALVGHGFAVESAGDGEHGLELASSGRFQLIVLDLALPGISGIATLRAIRGVRPELPVLVLSAMSDVESKVRCLELGANDYMTKPFALAELVARVRARLRESGAPASDRFLRVGDVTLDLQRQDAEMDGVRVALSGREFELLAYLMRRAGTVCSREQLLAGAWDCPFDPGTNVVDVYVRRLRRKLGGGTIETLRNVGYTFQLA
jgi:two-component system copper resistance phosphate regulon response regulator CusR